MIDQGADLIVEARQEVEDVGVGRAVRVRREGDWSDQGDPGGLQQAVRRLAPGGREAPRQREDAARDQLAGSNTPPGQQNVLL